jgi:hypothetical protein
VGEGPALFVSPRDDSYMVANEETWTRGVVLSFASALLQALVAVVLSLQLPNRSKPPSRFQGFDMRLGWAAPDVSRDVCPNYSRTWGRALLPLCASR